jgi:putative transposase
LNLPRRIKKRVPVRPRQSFVVVPRPNEVWAVDFMGDTLYGGRRFRTLNVLDEGVREGLAIEVDTSLPAARVVRVLEQVTAWRGLPKAIRLDNGPELVADRFVQWCEERGVALWHIQPGKPTQNAFIERFNRTYRVEVLNAYLFESLEQVREISAEWLQSYNEERPHEALAGLPPATYRAQITANSSPLKVSP